MKDLIFYQCKILSYLFLSMTLSVFLLAIRIKITHSFFLIFLVWNLFLAFIPYAITLYMQSLTKIKALYFVLLSGIWLLLLPNAPYIITDLLHLRLSEGSLVWLDILIVVSFAVNGLILYTHSLKEMASMLRDKVKPIYVNTIVFIIHFAAAFGMYLGRFLRYNSWDILHNPFIILEDCFQFIFYPVTYWKVWLFTFGFGSFLAMFYNLTLLNKKTES